MIIRNGLKSARFSLVHAISLFKSVNTAARINKLLATRIERMALRANFNSDLGLGGGGFKSLSACTLDYALFILRMDSFLHFVSPPIEY